MIKEQSDQHTRTAALIPQQKLNLVAVTWNLYGSVPSPESVTALFQLQQLQDKTDIICFGTQQCQRSLFASFCLQSKDQWEQLLSHLLPHHYLAATEVMRGLHIAILVKNNLKSYFQLEKKDKLRAGKPCNTMGNKGAISVQFSILGQPFQVLNCHLAAHQDQCQTRNQTINRILDQLVRKDSYCQVIFLGDLNYRIDMTKQHYKQLINNKGNTDAIQQYSKMIDKDQLRLQKNLQMRFLQLFQQGDIDFPPTYKIGLNSGEYHRQRIPGWTDRIFHRKAGKLVRKLYGCAYGVLGCDHRPVYAVYQMPLDENALTFTSEHMVGVKGSQNCQLI